MTTTNTVHTVTVHAIAVHKFIPNAVAVGHFSVDKIIIHALPLQRMLITNGVGRFAHLRKCM
jgi:hypothetical protein